MAYDFTPYGVGWQLIPRLVVLCTEVRAEVRAGRLDVTNLGLAASPEHRIQSPISRHNPMKAPNGVTYVCAADWGGPDHRKIAEFEQALYKAHVPGFYPNAFAQFGDGYGLHWFDGEEEWTGRDLGHAHTDPTMLHTTLLVGAWWVPELMSTAPLGFGDWLRTGRLSTQGGAATQLAPPPQPKISEENEMERQLRPGEVAILPVPPGAEQVRITQYDRTSTTVVVQTGITNADGSGKIGPFVYGTAPAHPSDSSAQVVTVRRRAIARGWLKGTGVDSVRIAAGDAAVGVWIGTATD